MFLCDSPRVAENCLKDSKVEPQSVWLEANVEIAAQPPCHSHEESWI